ncbi:MAG: helix-turn-helix transcriptional regulator [Clostridia bacterium]|nr:helix-turn-helix transcriptional regulator [Clostridia bacterium]
MSINSYKEYYSLTPNKHNALAPALINKAGITTDGTADVSVYRTDAEEVQELFTHNTIDILYALDCDAEVMICGKALKIKRYNILFIAPEVPYRVSVEKNGIMPVITVNKSLVSSHFHRISVLDGVLSGFFADALWGELSSSYLLFTSLSNTGIESAVNMLISEQLHSNAYSQFIKIQLLMCMMGYLSSQSANTYRLSPGKITRSEQISKILTYMQDNYRNVTLEKLAEHFHYTVPYVSKLVRSATGLTFTEILREMKFDVCRSLLLNSDLKINKIAEVAGFQNTDHFNRVFKKHMGITPTEFKKKSIDK